MIHPCESQFHPRDISNDMNSIIRMTRVTISFLTPPCLPFHSFVVLASIFECLFACVLGFFTDLFFSCANVENTLLSVGAVLLALV